MNGKVYLLRPNSLGGREPMISKSDHKRYQETIERIQMGIAGRKDYEYLDQVIRRDFPALESPYADIPEREGKTEWEETRDRVDMLGRVLGFLVALAAVGTALIIGWAILL